MRSILSYLPPPLRPKLTTRRSRLRTHLRAWCGSPADHRARLSDTGAALHMFRLTYSNRGHSRNSAASSPRCTTRHGISAASSVCDLVSCPPPRFRVHQLTASRFPRTQSGVDVLRRVRRRGPLDLVLARPYARPGDRASPPGALYMVRKSASASLRGYERPLRSAANTPYALCRAVPESPRFLVAKGRVRASQKDQCGGTRF